MYEREKFEKLKLIEILEKVSKELESEIDGYIIGGLAMMFHGTKLATKDIDIVFDSHEKAYEFMKHLKPRGFHEVQHLTKEYRKIEAHAVLEGPDECRFDIFIGSVCGGLILTEEMKKRATKVLSLRNLNIFAMSPEDVFLLKSIAQREDDLADMATIAAMGINWVIIEIELKSQPNYWKWLPLYFSSLEALESEYNVSSPSKEALQEEAELCIGMITILQRMDSPLATDAIVKILDGDEAFALSVLSKMSSLGIIKEVSGFWILNRDIYHPNNHLLAEKKP
jgi:hypothetical protein